MGSFRLMANASLQPFVYPYKFRPCYYQPDRYRVSLSLWTACWIKAFSYCLSCCKPIVLPFYLFYPIPIAICGISGGVFGLAAAYFTDHEDLSIKEWIYAILFFAFLMIIFGLQSKYQSHQSIELGFQVDHYGHILGAMGAIIYCRLKPNLKKLTT